MAHWLRYCPTSWNMMGAIPVEVTGVFIKVILPTALWPWGSTQPETEKITRNISWGGKGGRFIGLETLPPSCADCLEIVGGSTSCSRRG